MKQIAFILAIITSTRLFAAGLAQSTYQEDESVVLRSTPLVAQPTIPTINVPEIPTPVQPMLPDTQSAVDYSVQLPDYSQQYQPVAYTPEDVGQSQEMTEEAATEEVIVPDEEAA